MPGGGRRHRLGAPRAPAVHAHPVLLLRARRHRDSRLAPGCALPSSPGQMLTIYLHKGDRDVPWLQVAACLVGMPTATFSP